MILNYLKIGLRSLLRHKGYSLLTIAGLSIGIACSLLLFAFIQHEGNFDSFQKDGDRIFRVVTQRRNADASIVRIGLSPIPLASALSSSFPQVEKTVTISDDLETIVHDNEAFKQPVLFASRSFFEVFSFPLIRGTAANVLSNPDGIVLTASTASKIFGDEDPVGKRLTLDADGNRELVVSGIAADPPSNTSVPFEAVVPIELLPGYGELLANWGSSNCYTFVSLLEGSDPGVLKEGFAQFVNLHYADRIRQGRESGSIGKGDDAWQLQLQPLRELHTDPTVRWGLVPVANPLQSGLLAAVAFAIVLIACMNYSILGIARSAERAREVGLRKVVGAGRPQLFFQFYAEAFAVALLAFAAGLVLAELLISEFNRLAQRTLSLGDLFSTTSIALCSLFVILITLVSGSYPALLVAGSKPVDALRSQFRLHGNNIAGKALVVLQFVFGIALMMSAVMMTRQMSFLTTKELGYSAKNVLVVPAENARYEEVQAFVSHAASVSGVKSVTTVNNTFTRGGMRTDIPIDGKTFKTEVYFVSSDFMRALGLTIVEGDNFPRGASESAAPMVIVNESLKRKSLWGTAVGRTIDFANKPRIIGVVKDFNFKSLKQEIQPAVFVLNTRASSSNVLLKLDPNDISGTTARLQAAWKKAAPYRPFEHFFLDADIIRQYAEDERWNQIVVYGAIVSLSIASMGLFGIASLSAARRRKEIGLRKVLGASVPGILSLLSKDFLTLVALANLIALPLAYIAVEQWLESFAYRTNWDASVVALSALGSVLIACATMAFQSIRSALSNPIDSLRYE